MKHKQRSRRVLWSSKGSASKRAYVLNGIGVLILALGTIPNTVSAQDAMTSDVVRDVTEVREVSPTRTGFSERNFDAENAGMSSDMDWNLSTQSGGGAQKSLNESDVRGVGRTGEFRSGAMRSGAMPGYLDPRFGASADLPIAGTNLGGSHADGVRTTNFALSRTFHIGQAEYQWFFRKSHKYRNNFDRGNGGYMVGIGYRF